MKKCAVSTRQFEPSDADKTFYQALEVPEPTLCPEERRRRRLAFRNERSLHYRGCDATGKRILSLYGPDTPFVVVDNDYWWSDEWDGTEYARDFDFNRTFFEQFEELLQSVPKMARIQQGEQLNSTFCNCTANNKDCFLIFSASGNEGCMHSRMLNWNTDCVDCMAVFNCELCYECIDCEDCYGCAFSESSKNCSDSYFLRDCIGCSNCIGCTNLRNKRYWIFNEPHSRADYERYRGALDFGSHAALSHAKEAFEALFAAEPRPEMEAANVENSSGNYIRNSRNALSCFQVANVEDCKYCDHLTNARSCMDVSFFGVSETNELLYECEAVGHGTFRVMFSKLIWGGGRDIAYSYECFASNQLFGCSGLKRKQFCILNKQYSEAGYHELKARIIEHMKDTGEWGEFFPMTMSPFSYNESLAGDLMPLTKDEVLARGLKWQPQPKPQKSKLHELPDNIAETPDASAGLPLVCETSGQRYRIERQELLFHRKLGLALPRLCPEERTRRRFAKIALPADKQRKCSDCSNSFTTAFDPVRHPKVVCSKCYEKYVD